VLTTHDFGGHDNGAEVEDAEHHVGHSECNQPNVSRLLHAIHATLESLSCQHNQIQQVADDSKDADRWRHCTVDNTINQQVTALSRWHVARPTAKQWTPDTTVKTKRECITTDQPDTKSLILTLTALLTTACSSEHSTKYSHMSNVSREIHTRQCCCTDFFATFHCRCHSLSK